MQLAQEIAKALQEDKGFVAYTTESELAAHVAPPEFDTVFHGIRSYWGSLVSVAVIEGDSLSPEDIARQAQQFHQFVRSLKPHTGTLQIRHQGRKAGNVELGSFGLLGYVFPQGCPPALIETIRRQKHGSALHKDYVVCWVLDGRQRKVIPHRWLPIGMFPGKRYLQSLLQ